MSARVRCGYKGCAHWLSTPGRCGRRLCPRNAEKAVKVTSTSRPDVVPTWQADPMRVVDVPTAQNQVTTLAEMDPSTPLSEVRFVVIDVETNDLDPQLGCVVQVSVTTCDGRGNIIDQWDTVICPTDGNVGRTDIHRITAEQAAAAPTFAQALPELLEQLDHNVVVAHNLWFDRRWLETEMRRAGYEPPDFAGLDTLDMARGFAGHDVADRRLSTLCERYGVELDGWHDAACDTTATAKLLPHLLDAADLRTVGDLTARVWDSHGSLRWPAEQPGTPTSTRDKARRGMLTWLRAQIT